MRVGILGGGQLARMLALAGYPLGFRFTFLDPAPHPPVASLGRVVQAGWDDPVGLERFREELDVVTLEFENVPAGAAALLAEQLPVFPPPGALETARDRMNEKKAFGALGIPVAPYHPIETREELEEGVVRLGLPAILKTRRLGYDGKGQHVLESPEDVEGAWLALGSRGPLLLESRIPFDRELSIVAVRGRGRETACYPLVENLHSGGILRRTVAPAAHVGPELQSTAEQYAGRLLDELDYVGVLAIELFQVGDDLLVNEMAPRVHNSGHWTQEGAECSQFENHLRAVAGLPLGSTAPLGHTVMLNLIGSVPPVASLLEIRGVHLHLYDKEPRPGRKLGHVNVTGADPEEVRRVAGEVERMLMVGSVTG